MNICRRKKVIGYLLEQTLGFLKATVIEAVIRYHPGRFRTGRSVRVILQKLLKQRQRISTFAGTFGLISLFKQSIGIL
ncbi:MAG: hypothetical protein WHX60_06070 [Armatimonadota bacterium]